jgi:hypothetical protein
LNAKPVNCVFAGPVLLEIFNHWHDELHRLIAEVLLPFHVDSTNVKPASADCFALKILTIVADFPIGNATSPALVRRLNLIFDNALDGRICLFDARPEIQPPSDPRRFTRRWWKESTQKFFRASRPVCQGRNPARDRGAFPLLFRPPVPAFPDRIPVPAEAAYGQACQTENPS